MQRQRSTLTGGVPGTGANAEWANMRQPESFAVLHGIISTDIGNRTRGSRQQQQHADEEEEEKEEGELAVQREQQQQLETERARAKIAMLSGEGSQQQQQQWQGPRQPLPGLGNCTIDGESPVYLRSLEWEVRLGSLGRDFRSWAAEATTQRQEYDIWRAKYLGDDKMQVKTSVELGNQADLAEAYLDPAFQRMPTKKIIVEDVNRTLSDVKLFTQDDIRCILKRILYVYACLNPAIGYIQGMNEILAPIVHVLHRDATYAAGRLAAEGKGEKGEEERVALMEGEYIRARSPAALAGWEVRGLIRNLRRLDCIESDAFRLFSKVMASIGAWFHSPKAINGEHDSAEEMEVVIKCARTQELLRIRDPAVFNQLKAMDIQPQLYMLKWIRILFAQIFPLENLLAVWDALFTAGIAREPFDLVDHICVTLLTLIRTSIIGQDYTKVLTNLFNYPKGAAPVSLVLNIAVSSMYSSLDRPFFEDPSLGAPFPRTIPPLDIYTQQSPARTPKRPVTPTPVNSSSNANTNVLEYSDNTSVGYSPSSSPSPQSRIKKRGPKDKLHEMVMARHQQKQQPNGSGGATPTQRYVELWERVTDLESVQEEVRNHVDQIIQDIAALCGSGNSSRKSSTSNGINGSVDEDNDDDDEEEEDEEKDEFYYADNGSLTQVLTDLHDIKYTLTCAQINE